MRLGASLDGLLGTESKIRVLRALFLYPEGTFTGRQLAGIAGLNHASAHNALRALAASGLVTTRTAGTSHIFSLNSRNHLHGALKNLFESERNARESAIGLLKAALRKSGRRQGLVFASIFGSVARRTEKSGSDIDLFIVVKKETDKEGVREILVKVEDGILEKFGNKLNPQIATLAELHAISGKQILEEIRKDGLVLAGEPTMLDRYL